MESKHGNCKEKSSHKELQKPSEPKCYSLPTLQKENAKLKYDLKVLQAAYHDKEILLNETLATVELIDKQNKELKYSLTATTSENEETRHQSTFTVEMKDAATWVSIETKNVSTSTSKFVVNVASEGDDEVVCKTVLFDEMVQELPYDDKNEIIRLNKNSEDPTFYSNMQEYFKKIGGANVSKVVNNILNAIATKKLQKEFAWDATASNSFQNLNKILSCIHSVVCSKENTQQNVNNVIKNALKNARSKF